MITCEDIRELAQFQYNDDDNCVLSFYFQPRRPQNKSHREEAILAKDLVREALHGTEKNGKNKCARADLQRILDLAGHLHGNQARAKAVFACGTRDFWREYDLPPQLPGTQLFVNRRFHLKPIAMLLGAHPQLWIALVDRHRARFFDLRLDELHEHNSMFHPLPRRGRSDGFAGYDAGHAERSKNDEVLHHFKDVAEHLKQAHDQGRYEKLVIGCQDTNWHDFELHLHPYVKNRLLGRFSADIAAISDDEVREHANRILHKALDQRRQLLVQEVLGQAKSNGRGVTGLRRVSWRKTILLVQWSAPDAPILTRTWCVTARFADAALGNWRMSLMALFPRLFVAMSNSCMYEMSQNSTVSATSPPYCVSALIRAGAEQLWPELQLASSFSFVILRALRGYCLPHDQPPL